ncbi:hypothetical protein PAV_11c01070 [Paenibacillus alvei DSM 29]|nr:hypothetical protein PAV_11c01070 [Paenibacillus alvei DSM 29]
MGKACTCERAEQETGPMKQCEVCEGTGVMYWLVKGGIKTGPCPCCSQEAAEDDHPGAR